MRVVITGASRGIGALAAIKLAEQGADIVVAARSDTIHDVIARAKATGRRAQ